MSLRTDFHAAFDELAPSTFGLPERVVELVQDQSSRRRRIRWSVRLRGPASLVAVFLLIALVVGVLVGGRVVRDWNAFTKHSAPAGGIDKSVLAQLETRPLQLPQWKSGEVCPGGPWDMKTGWSGAGPLTLSFAGVSSTDTPWGGYYFRQATTDANLSGPVLVRARVLDTGQSVIFVGEYASGAFIGTDTIQGKEVQQYDELVLDASHPPAARSGQSITWNFTQGTPKGVAPSPTVSGNSLPPVPCVGWQVDGPDFTETFVTSG